MEVIAMHHGWIVEASEDAVLLEFFKDGYSELAVALKELCFAGTNKVTKPQKELKTTVYFSAVLDFQSWKPDVWKVVSAWTKRKPLEAYKVEAWKTIVASLYKDKRHCLMGLKLLSQKRITEKGLYESLLKIADVEDKAVRHVKNKIELNADGGSATFSVLNSCLYFDLFNDATYKIRKYISDQYPEMVNFFAFHSEAFNVSKTGIVSLSLTKECLMDNLGNKTDHDRRSLGSNVGASHSKSDNTCLKLHNSSEGKNETKLSTEATLCIEDESAVRTPRRMEEEVPSFVEPVLSVTSAKELKKIEANAAVHSTYVWNTTMRTDSALIIRASVGSSVVEPFPNVHAPTSSENVSIFCSKLKLGTVRKTNKSVAISGASLIEPFPKVHEPRKSQMKAIVDSNLETVDQKDNGYMFSSSNDSTLIGSFPRVHSVKELNIFEDINFVHSERPLDTMKRTDNAVINTPSNGPILKDVFPRVLAKTETSVIEDVAAVQSKLTLGSASQSDNALIASASNGVKLVDLNHFIIPEKTNYSICEILDYTGHKGYQNGLTIGNEYNPKKEKSKEASFQASVKSPDIKTSRNVSVQTISSGPILSMAHLIMN